MVKSRKSSTRKTTKRSSKGSKTKTKGKATKSVVEAPWDEIRHVLPGNVRILEAPWGMFSFMRQNGSVWVKGVGWVVPESKMTPILDYYAVKDFSWGKYVEDEVNGVKFSSVPTADTGEFVLRDDQLEDVEKITACWSVGGPEFLVASGTGLGKTVVAVAAINQTPGEVVVVVCPKSVIPSWRATIKKMGDSGKRWVIINYESTKKLLKPPQSALDAKKTSTKNKHIALYGTVWFKANIVVCDETHKVKNPTSQQSRVVDKFMDQGAKGLRLSATPGGPADLHYLRRGLAWATGDKVFQVGEKDFSDYVSWCRKNCIQGIVPAKFGNGIAFEGSKQDVDNLNRILFSSNNVHKIPWSLKRVIDSWPQQERIGMPMDLTPEQLQLYEMEWESFKKEMAKVNNLRSYSSDRKKVAAAKMKGLAAQIRYRQKVGSLKTDFALELTKELLDDGNQVVISCVFHDTVDKLSELLDGAKIPFVALTGKNVSNRESDRVRFQKGEVKVMISSITTGVSYHANDSLVGGNSVPRRMIILETGFSDIEVIQTEGRTQRNGEEAPCIYPMLSDTIDVKVIETVIRRMGTQFSILGDHKSNDLLDDLAQTFGFQLVD